MKHVPMRTCIQTREKLPKNELARFAIDPEDSKFILDESGKIRARGANLKMDLDIYDEAARTGAFERALERKITEDEYASVRGDFEKFIKKVEFRQGRDKVSIRVKGESINLD